MYCNTEIGCKYGNTKDKDAFFKHSGHKKARKFRPCLIKTCTWGKQCTFTHDALELLYSSCDHVGAGHAVG